MIHKINKPEFSYSDAIVKKIDRFTKGYGRSKQKERKYLKLKQQNWFFCYKITKFNNTENNPGPLAYFEKSSTFCTPTIARTADGTPTNEQNIIRQFRMSRTIEKWKFRFNIFMIYLYLDRQQSPLQISDIVYRIPTWWLRSTLQNKPARLFMQER